MKKKQIIMTTLATTMLAPTIVGSSVTVNALESEQKTSILFLAIHTKDNKISDATDFIIKDLDTGETFNSTSNMKGVTSIHGLNIGHRYSITPKDNSKEIIKFLGSDKTDHSENIFYCVDKSCDPDMCGGGALAFDKDGNSTLTDIFLDDKIKKDDKAEKKKMPSPISLHNEKNLLSDVTDFVITDLDTGESFENHTDIQGMIFFENLIVGHRYSLLPKNTNRHILNVGANDDKTYNNREFLCEEIDNNILFSFENNGKKILTSIYIGEKGDTDKDNTETPNDNSFISLEQLKINVTINGKPIPQDENVYVSFINWDESDIPNTLYTPKLDQYGETVFNEFKANSRYEIRLGGTNIKFDKEFIRFTTDENCKINTIDGKKINKDFSGTINFKSYEKTSNEVKTFPVTIKAVLEDGTPAEGVTFTANTLAPKMQSYKDTTTGKDGLATVELEGQEGGRQYAFCVAKNAQFMWQGNPGSIVVTIDEKGNISINNKTPNKFGKATFIVEKKDQTYLYTNFKKTLKEAEEKFSSNKYTDESKKELGRVLIGAREEDSKAETLPQYAKGYTEQLKDAIKLLVKKNLPSSKNSNSSKSSSQSSIANKDELTKKEINEKIKYERIAGKDRVLTSISVSKRYYKKSDTVILANADNYADALAASSYASSVDAPILLVKNSTLNRELTSEIERLSAKNVVIVGGESAISDDVKKDLSNKNVERVAGENRFETSQKLAEKTINNGYKDSMIIVDGKNFPDALSANSLLKKYKGAVILVDDSASGIKNVEFAKNKKLKKNLIIGGEASVSKNIENNIDSTVRIAGKNRYETSKKIAEEVMDKNGNIFVATGNDFADALSISPVLTRNNSALLLVNRGYDNLATFKNKYEPNNITSIGGINSISDSVMNNLKK
nr:cell wall-binding repeat-containing protein [uncultured Peptostreptococcus sp.]